MRIYHQYLKRSSHNQTKSFSINRIAFKNEILMIYGYPNINFSAYSIPPNVSAVLYVPYHSGTACTENENPDYTLTYFINRCKKQNINVYLSGIKSKNGIYASLDKLINAGAIPLTGIFRSCSICKTLDSI